MRIVNSDLLGTAGRAMLISFLIIILFLFQSYDSFAQVKTVIDGDYIVATGQTLVVNENDTLIITGTLELKNSAILTIETNAVCIIYGDLIVKNQVNLSVGAHLVVGGDLIAPSGSGKVTVDVASTAAFYILGTVSDNSDDFNCDNTSAYDPPGDTNCNYGDIISMEDNENDSTGIYDLFVLGDSEKGVTPVYSELCSGASVIISAVYETAESYQWCDSSGVEISGETSFEFEATEPGEYFVKIYDSSFDVNPTISHRAKVVGASMDVDIVANNSPVCSGSAAEFTLVGTDGAIVNYNINAGSTQSATLLGGTATVSVLDVQVDQTLNVISVESGSTACDLSLSSTVTVKPTPETPTVSSNSPVCHGSTIELSTPTVADATYYWTGPNGFTSTEQNPTLTANYYSNAGTYSVTVTVDGCTSDPGTTDVVIDLTSVGGWISYVDPICAGESVTLTLNGNTGDVIYWERRVDSGTWETVAGTSTTLIDTPPSGGAWEYRAFVQNGSCEAVASSPITVTVHPTMTITLGADPEVCQNITTVSLTYSETSGAPDAWLLVFDASAIAAGFDSPQTSSLGAAPGTIPVNVPYGVAAGTYNAILTVFSNYPACTSEDYPVSITVTEEAPASVLIEGNDTVCAGTEVTYTAIPTNGGTSPSYQWKVNDIDEGTDSNIFTYTPVDGDTVSCVMTSNSICASGSPATSNKIGMTVGPIPNATISSNNGPVCPADDVLFTLNGSENSTVFYSINGGVQSSTVLTGGTATITVAAASETQVLSLDSVILGGCNQSLTGISDTALVLDTTPPTITYCPANYLVDSQDSICGAQINYAIPTAVDDCSDVSLTLLEGLTSGDTFPVGLTTVSYELADVSGNADTCSFTVLVTDIQPPKFRTDLIPDTITVNNTPGECGAVVTFTTPTAYDNCGGVVINRTSVDSSGTFFPIGITQVTYEARDISDNVVNDTIFVRVVDAEPPVIDTCPEIVYSTVFDTTINIASLLLIDVYDNCPGAFLASIPENVDFSVSGTTNFQSVATDLYGNTDTCSFDIIVQETSPIEKDPAVDTVCQGTTVSYYFNGDWLSKSKWSVDGPDATISDQDSQTTEITFNAAGVYTIKAKILDTGRPTFYTDFMVVVEGDPSLVADVTISVSPSDTVCAGDEVTFTAVPVNGGDAPTYQWQIDGTAIPGETESTFVSSTLSDGQKISCVMTSSIVCVSNNPAISNIIEMEIVPLPTIVLNSGTAEACFGENSATLDFSTTTGSPTKYNIDFDLDAESAGFTDVTEANLLPGNIVLSVPVTAAAGNYNAVLTVLNASNCESIDYPITIKINALPATGEIIPD